MNDVLVGDENLISTTRAAELSGYSKDYVGQLCREEKIDCRRVSGNWYVREESIKMHQESVGEDSVSKSSAYSIKVGNVRDDTFKYDGIEYVSTSRAAEITGYAQDYVGQLARNGEIEARKVGRCWFVGRQSLTEHKKYNDGLLAAVQAQSSGVHSEKEGKIEQKNDSVAIPISVRSDIEPGDINFNVRYISENDKPLVPKMQTKPQQYASDDIHLQSVSQEKNTSIPIRPSANSSIAHKPYNHATREDRNTQYKAKTFHIPKKKSNQFHVGSIFFTLLLVAVGIGVFFVFDLKMTIVERYFDTSQFDGYISFLQESYGEVFPGAEFTYSTE